MLECCWGEQSHTLMEAVREVGLREATYFVVAGGPGQGVQDVVHAVGQTADRDSAHRATIWVDAVIDEHLVPHARVSRQDVDRIAPHPGHLQPIHEALHLLGDDEAGHGRLVLVDAFHRLPAVEAKVLVEWLQQQRFSDTVVVIGVHPCETSPELRQLLTLLPPLTRVDLPPLTSQALAAHLVQRHPTCPAHTLAAIAGFAHGVPALAFEAADHHCVQSRPAELNDPVQQALRLAVRRVCLPVLARQREEDFRLGLAAVLAAPEGQVADVATVLDHAGAPRVETLLTELGLLGGGAERAATIRAAVIEGTETDLLHSAGTAALQLLERIDAPPERVLELVELLGPEDGNYLVVAKRAVDAFLQRGLDRRALELAQHALRRSGCPDVIAWARSVALSLAMSHDWTRARAMMIAAGPGDPLVREVASSDRLSPEFGLDAAAVMGSVTEALLAEGGADPATVLHRHLLTGRTVAPRQLATLRQATPATDHGPVQAVEVSSLLLTALRGGPAEARLGLLEQRLTASVGTFNVGAHEAALLAATQLALANHEAALEWSNVATITAGPQEVASRGLGHVVAALAQLRLGSLHEGAVHAETAAETFAALRAEHLVHLARAVGAHLAIEAGEPGCVPEAPSDRCHPVLEIYTGYVGARHLLAQERLDEGIAELFRVGRHLGSLGLANPTLVNWRPHLIAVFRGTHREGFADTVETDLVRAMRRWQRANPASAARRSHILGALARELFGPGGDAPAQGEHTTAAEAVDLSEAETRVVRLVVQGRSNREVARELYLSKRTIDTHLSNVYRKLGLSSRGELSSIVRTSVPLAEVGQTGPADGPDGDQALAPVYG